ncbi:hypothetical protein ABIB15_002538 [Marisediminicola sp. UYEF4]|uniref:hypothetical protein n=1 Tax=Marisediminicola sp. UYEF4 TaxID=1756384 RepID=UPI0033986388
MPELSPATCSPARRSSFHDPLNNFNADIAAVGRISAGLDAVAFAYLQSQGKALGLIVGRKKPTLNLSGRLNR